MVYKLSQRKPSRNGLVKRSHMGSLASIVASNQGPNFRRPSSLHLPVSGTLSASSAMVSPILSVATRAINNNLEAVYPPLIFPAAEFAPGNHMQGRPKPPANSAKGTVKTRIILFLRAVHCAQRKQSLFAELERGFSRVFAGYRVLPGQFGLFESHVVD